MIKWYCLYPNGVIRYVGEFKTFEDAAESLEYEYVWLTTEKVARQWLADLKGMLEN